MSHWSEELVNVPASVREQLRNIARNRKTDLPRSVPSGLDDAFARNADSQRQWSAFVRRQEAEGAPERFIDVVVAVREFAYPALEAVAQGRSFEARWSPEKGAWSE